VGLSELSHRSMLTYLPIEDDRLFIKLPLIYDEQIIIIIIIIIIDISK